MVSLLLCLLDWCMAVPLSLLLEPITAPPPPPPMDGHAPGDAPLLDYIYRVGMAHEAGGYGGRRGPNALQLPNVSGEGIHWRPSYEHKV